MSATAPPELPGVEHHWIDTGRLLMHYAEAGDPGGEPAMLVHGWPQHFYEWRGVIPALAGAGYRVICPDLRGLGWSEAPRRGYRKEELAEDLVALLDALAIERVHLAGHDWGGFAGFLLAILHPARVRSFLPCNIIHPWLRLSPSDLRAAPRTSYQWALSTPGLNRRIVQHPAFMHRFLKTGSLNKEAWSDEDVEIFAERLRDPDRVHASAKIYRTFVTREFWGLVRGRYRDRRLSVPTLLLFGARDFVIRPHYLEGYEPHADDMRVELVADAAHFIVEEKPALVAERALSLFAAT
jgi:pimeloyl-ACP methyl ester carboxylesterase